MRAAELVDLSCDEPEAWLASACQLTRLLCYQLRGHSSTAGFGVERDPGVVADGDEVVAAAVLIPALVGVASALRRLELRLTRLAEEFCGLDVCEAEALFSTSGAFASTAAEAEETARLCGAAAAQTLAGSRTLGDAMEVLERRNIVVALTALEAGTEALSGFLSAATSLAARQDAAVLRAKESNNVIVVHAQATVQTRAFVEVASARALLSAALAEGRRLDFPVVTEICERVHGDASELTAVTRLLADTLRDGGASASRRLKALTVAHELLYDERACGALAATPGLLEVFAEESSSSGSWRPSSRSGPAPTPGRPASGLECAGGPAEETTALLAAELLRRLSAWRPPAPERGTSASGCRGWLPLGCGWCRAPARARRIVVA